MHGIRPIRRPATGAALIAASVLAVHGSAQARGRRWRAHGREPADVAAGGHAYGFAVNPLNGEEASAMAMREASAE